MFSMVVMQGASCSTFLKSSTNVYMCSDDNRATRATIEGKTFLAIMFLKDGVA